MESTFDRVMSDYISNDSGIDDSSSNIGNMDNATFEEFVRLGINDRVGDSAGKKDIFKAIKIKEKFLLTGITSPDDDIAISKVLDGSSESFNMLLYAIIDTYGISLTYDETNIDSVKYEDIVDTLYHSFVFNFFENMTYLFHGYLIDNETMILDKFGVDLKEKAKDITINSIMEKIGKDKVAVSTMYNMSKIVGVAIEEYRTAPLRIIEDIIKYDKDEYYNFKLSEYFALSDNDDNDSNKVPICGVDNRFSEAFLDVLNDENIMIKLIAELENLVIEEFLYLD